MGIDDGGVQVPPITELNQASNLEAHRDPIITKQSDENSDAGPSICSETASNTVSSEISDITTGSTRMVDSTPCELKDVETPVAVEDGPQPSKIEDVTSTQSTPVKKKYRAPSPPRWRFVAEAKKSAGYSSREAGKIVRGKSSEELGAKYIAPDITYAERIDQQREIQELNVPDIKYSTFQKEEREVGKLSIDNSVNELVEVLEGGIVISHDPEKISSEQEISSRAWSKLEPRNKDSDNTVQVKDDKDKWANLLEDETVPVRELKEVGKLKFCPDDNLDELFEGEIVKHKLGMVDKDALATSADDEGDGDKEDYKNSDSGSQQGDDADHEEVEVDDDLSSKGDLNGNSSANEPRRRRKLWILLLLIPLLITAAIVGVVLGKKESFPEEDKSGVFAFGTVIQNATDQPSSQPSANPSYVDLPTLNSKPPSAKPTLALDLTDMPASRNPTSTPSMLQVSTDQPSSAPTTQAPTQQPLTFVGICPELYELGSSYQLGTQVQSEGIVYECISLFGCGTWGFEPGSDSGLWKEKWTVIGSCYGTASPTSSTPTASPTTLSPTQQPLDSLGGCPESYVLSSYQLGTQVQSEGIVYECISLFGCGTWGFEPGSDSGLWEEKWTVVGSCSGTIAPTTFQPSKQPSAEPIVSPSGQPTLSPITYSPTTQPNPSPVTNSPSKQPTSVPTNYPLSPTQFPTQQPSQTPINSTKFPSRSPSKKPTFMPITLPPTTLSPSKSPTTRPSNSPIDLPTSSPSMSPTKLPTKTPSYLPTNSPSKKPTLSPSFIPSKTPSEKPTEVPTDGPTFDPTPEPSFQPTSVPSREPSPTPTPKPTPLPTPPPSPVPTPLPTTSPTKKPTTPEPTCLVNGDFNLCLAIDMSGSICGGGLCENCGDCQSGGQNTGVCCNNFANMIEFSRSLVKSLGDLPTNQDFSIVHFATGVDTASTLQNSNQAFKEMNKLVYTGGKTNLAGAINSCQSTLDDSPSDRKNLMLVITDGAPSIPEFNAKEAATTAANNAKDKDTFIIPILIEDPRFQTPEVRYLENNISSDGQVFVADFGGLTDLQDAVFEQVTCQAN